MCFRQMSIVYLGSLLTLGKSLRYPIVKKVGLLALQHWSGELNTTSPIAARAL